MTLRTVTTDLKPDANPFYPRNFLGKDLDSCQTNLDGISRSNSPLSNLLQNIQLFSTQNPIPLENRLSSNPSEILLPMAKVREILNPNKKDSSKQLEPKQITAKFTSAKDITSVIEIVRKFYHSFNHVHLIATFSALESIYSKLQPSEQFQFAWILTYYEPYLINLASNLLQNFQAGEIQNFVRCLYILPIQNKSALKSKIFTVVKQNVGEFSVEQKKLLLQTLGKLNWNSIELSLLSSMLATQKA